MHIKRYLKTLFVLAKNFIGKRLYFFLAFFVKGDRILLIPPTELVGSFGDELMVLSFIQQFENQKIDIYTETDRRDLFAPYGNVYFRDSRKLIKWHKYKSVQVLGADMMSGSYGDYLPLHYIDILRIANNLEINTKILGFSLKKKNSVTVMDRLRKLSKTTKLFLRDVDSYSRAKDLDLQNINLVADLAFFTDYPLMKDTAFDKWLTQNSEKLKIAICPNALHAKAMGVEKYLQDLTSLIEKLSCKDFAFLILYHDLRDHCDGYSDKDISRKLQKLLGEKISTYFPEVRNGSEMKYYISRSDVTLTGRMHFGISGLSVGIPMIGISYEDKFSGLQKLLGINPGESLIDDYSDIQKDYDKIIDFLKNIDHYKARVSHNLKQVTGLAAKNFN